MTTIRPAVSAYSPQAPSTPPPRFGAENVSKAKLAEADAMLQDVWGEFGGFSEITEQIIQLVASVGRRLETLLGKIRKFMQHFAKKAYDDHLTGLHNKRLFDEQLAEELSEAKDKQIPLALMLFDLDRFKGINDTFGHAAGDQALKHFSQIIEHVAPKNTHICRLGGDEFAVIFSEPSSPQACRKVAEKIQKELQTELTVMDGDETARKIHLASSQGIAYLDFSDPNLAEDIVDSHQIYKMADGLLYEAKAEGKAIRAEREANDNQTPYTGHITLKKFPDTSEAT